MSVSAEKAPYEEMSEEKLVEELKGSLLILSTTDPYKREVFRTMMTSLGLHDEICHPESGKPAAGVDLFFTDSGSLDIVPSRTAEQEGSYEGNLYQKALQQRDILQDEEVRERIRRQIDVEGSEIPRNVNIMGMTEDSGISLIFGTPENPGPAAKQRFMEAVKEIVQPRLRPKDYKWLVDKLEEKSGDGADSGFPGANLHPLQDSLGGFNNLMHVIYDAAEKAEIKELRFRNTSHVSFVSPNTGKIYSREFNSYGRFLTRREYKDKIQKLPDIGAINSDFVQIFDVPPGSEEEPKTFDKLIEEGFFIASRGEHGVKQSRRDLVTWLQEFIGPRELPPDIEATHFRVGYISPETREKEPQERGLVDRPTIENIDVVAVPSYDTLLKNPDARFFDDADAIVLMPSMARPDAPNWLHHDPNLALVLGAIVIAQTDPQSMRIPIILDNRRKDGREGPGPFAPVLKLITEDFMKGRMMGSLPFLVANNNEDMQRYFREVQRMTRLSPKIKMLEPQAVGGEQEKLPEPIEALPEDDGIFSMFIGGGHNNNTKDDLQNAYDLGYRCAEEGLRIVTGAGSVEGSMGAVHTGFIQYHLDQIQNGGTADAINMLMGFISRETAYEDIPENLRKRFNNIGIDGIMGKYKTLSEAGESPQPLIAELDEKYKNLMELQEDINPRALKDGEKYDAEEIIKQDPSLINEIADRGFIPRRMFYGYSMEDLLKLETPHGNPPPGITYSDTGNLDRRLQYLLAPGTKVFMPGSVGTDQEFVLTIEQHLKARFSDSANDGFFIDGTADKDATIIIFNRKGCFDELLEHYGLAGRGSSADERRERHNIIIVEDDTELLDAVSKRAGNWTRTWQEKEERRKEPGIPAEDQRRRGRE